MSSPIHHHRQARAIPTDSLSFPTIIPQNSPAFTRYRVTLVTLGPPSVLKHREELDCINDHNTTTTIDCTMFDTLAKIVDIRNADAEAFRTYRSACKRPEKGRKGSFAYQRVYPWRTVVWSLD